MPTLIRRDPQGGFAAAEDRYVTLGEADPVPEAGGVILPLARLTIECAELKLDRRAAGALFTVDDDLRALLPLLLRLSVVAIDFPKYRDGRGYTTAALLRSRYGFTGELRAVGDVLIEEAPQFLRCGFDSFAVADGSTPKEWAAKAMAHRHVYQRAPDGRAPVFAERVSVATPA